MSSVWRPPVRPYLRAVCIIYDFEFCILSAVQLLPNCYERVTQLFVQQSVQLTSDETKLVLWGVCAADWWISTQIGQYSGKLSHVMNSTLHVMAM